MKKVFTSGLLLTIGLFAICSCSKSEKANNKASDTIEEEAFRNTLSSTDSLNVLNLSDSLMTLFKQKDLDGATNLIYEFDEEGALHKVSVDRKKKLLRQFTMFPVYDYKISDLKFNTAEQNIVAFQIVFEEPQPGTIASTTSFALSPVKVDGNWYLTIRESATADGHNTQAITEEGVE